MTPYQQQDNQHQQDHRIEDDETPGKRADRTGRRCRIRRRRFLKVEVGKFTRLGRWGRGTLTRRYLLCCHGGPEHLAEQIFTRLGGMTVTCGRLDHGVTLLLIELTVQSLPSVLGGYLCRKQKPQLIAGMITRKGLTTVRTDMGVGLHRNMAGMAEAKPMRDARCMAGNRPHLMRGGPANDRGRLDAAGSDLCDQDVETTARSERLRLVTHVPGPHADVGCLEAEWFEPTPARIAAIMI